MKNLFMLLVSTFLISSNAAFATLSTQCINSRDSKAILVLNAGAAGPRIIGSAVRLNTGSYEAISASDSNYRPGLYSFEAQKTISEGFFKCGTTPIDMRKFWCYGENEPGGFHGGKPYCACTDCGDWFNTLCKVFNGKIEQTPTDTVDCLF